MVAAIREQSDAAPAAVGAPTGERAGGIGDREAK